MKHFMVCINPECDQHLHPIPVSGGELIVAANIGLPVIASITGYEPPVEAAITALEVFLESNPENKMKDMAYEKLKSLQAQLTEECPEPKTSESMGSIAINPTASDDYYQSSEYKAHRIRMDELEVERVKAETQLVQAKARLTNAEAQKIELNLPTLKRVKPETN